MTCERKLDRGQVQEKLKLLAEEITEKQGEGKEIAMCEYIDMLEARGEARGENKGETRLAKLIQILLKEKKDNEIQAVSESRAKRHEMYR